MRAVQKMHVLHSIFTLGATEPGELPHELAGKRMINAVYNVSGVSSFESIRKNFNQL